MVVCEIGILILAMIVALVRSLRGAYVSEVFRSGTTQSSVVLWFRRSVDMPYIAPPFYAQAPRYRPSRICSGYDRIDRQDAAQHVRGDADRGKNRGRAEHAAH